jgi:hypothetical protein
MATALVVAALALGGAGVLASSLGGDTGPVLDRLGHIAAIAGVPVASAQPHPHPHPPGTPPHGQNRAPQRPGAGAGAANAERARAPAESTLASKAFRGNSRAGSMLFWLFAALMIAGSSSPGAT